MRQIIIFCFSFCLLWMLLCPVGAVAQNDGSRSGPALDAQAEDRLNLYCLRLAYPAITALETDADGSRWLLLGGGGRVPYSRSPQADGAGNVDVRSSMDEIYPLEPKRLLRDGPPCTAGQRRSLALLQALYGGDAAGVTRGLQTAYVQAYPVRLSLPAARALQKADAHLVLAVNRDPEIYPLLKPGSAFAWRVTPDGEPDPHAYGIAVDLNSELAPDWQGSPLAWHPLQQAYPPAIVTALEEQGFIWGGKWQRYDLAHFEYRPELIYKARILRALEEIRDSF